MNKYFDLCPLHHSIIRCHFVIWLKVFWLFQVAFSEIFFYTCKTYGKSIGLDTFFANLTISYPLKTPENLRFFQGSSIQFGGIRAFFFPGVFLRLGLLGHFGSKNKARKIWIKKILNYSKSLCIIFCFRMS